MEKDTQILKTELFPGAVPADVSARTHNARLVDLYKLRFKPHCSGSSQEFKLVQQLFVAENK